MEILKLRPEIYLDVENLSDKSRYLFYELINKKYPSWIVNDGSDLDEPKLK
mgnify:FL=1